VATAARRWPHVHKDGTRRLEIFRHYTQKKVVPAKILFSMSFTVRTSAWVCPVFHSKRASTPAPAGAGAAWPCPLRKPPGRRSWRGAPSVGSPPRASTRCAAFGTESAAAPPAPVGKPRLAELAVRQINARAFALRHSPCALRRRPAPMAVRWVGQTPTHPGPNHKP
jgi:hypothetical protein